MHGKVVYKYYFKKFAVSVGLHFNSRPLLLLYTLQPTATVKSNKDLYEEHPKQKAAVRGSDDQMRAVLHSAETHYFARINA